jgi:hypothetical protein
MNNGYQKLIKYNMRKIFANLIYALDLILPATNGNKEATTEVPKIFSTAYPDGSRVEYLFGLPINELHKKLANEQEKTVN